MPRPFPRIPYAEAMLKYGSDKPDLRNPLVIADVSDLFAGSAFKVFAKAVADGGVVRAIPAPGAAAQPRSWFDRLNEWAREQGAARSVMGWGMLVEQAAESFYLWRGVRPDTAAVLKQLSVNA